MMMKTNLDFVQKENIIRRYKMASKPDYIDIDGDGNTTEPMKTAAKQKKVVKKKKGGVVKKMKGGGAVCRGGGSAVSGLGFRGVR